MFSGVGSFFALAFTNGLNSAKAAWSGAKSGFTKIWNTIKSVFSSVGSWFKTTFSGAWGAIKKVFEPNTVKTFFGTMWDNIKEKFTSIGKGVGDVIGTAFKDAINWAIDTIEDTLNFLPDKINPALQAITDFTHIEVPLFPTVDLPRLAKGGIVDKSMLANIGEDGKEAVIPLEKNKGGLKQIANLLADEMTGSRAFGGNIKGGDTVYNFTQNNTSPKALSRYEIYRQTKNLISAMNGVK